ncbi:hypothetical protein [Actinoplanes rectilineatus]|uniref:hypothetical protein n=1 Tax=Actinoplanes rectilineatus TaxID=113571 RepID=UPI0005F2DD30|nr:hypothetical protein [Actinoplanes rectilineatus]
MTGLLTELTHRILAAHTPHPTRVGIDGCSAAGKTTLADNLAAHLRTRTPRPVIRVGIDHFKRPVHDRVAHPAGTPESYYHDMFDTGAVRDLLLAPLGPGGTRRYRTGITDITGRTPVDSPWQQAPDDAILIADGAFLQKPDYDGLWDLRIHLHITLDEVLRRGTHRDQAWMPSAEAAATRYRTYYIPGERLYLNEIDPAAHADILIDNQDLSNPFIVYAHP